MNTKILAAIAIASILALTALTFQSFPGSAVQAQALLTVQRSADRMSATGTWTPNQGAEFQAFFVVAKLLAGEPDSTGQGVKIDTFRYVDYPLAGDVGSLVITGLDPSRDYSYGVISTARDSNGNWVWSQWETFQDDTLALADTGSPEMDRAALVALYNATDGPNWTNSDNWLSDEPIGEWYGITTDDDDRVIELYLYDNQLSGDIPPELGNLTKLQTLSLWGNDLSGGIPPELGKLTNLIGLFLWNNDLSGVIPPELGKLSKLEYLSLLNNRLTGDIPSELGKLSNLRSLYLRDNELSGCIPNDLGDTQRNDFSELGLSFCAPRASDPADKAVLQAFYNATGGSHWSTTTNWLSEEPMGLWYGVATDSDGRVTGLSLWSNDLSGSIPTNLDSLSKLEYLSLVNNQLSGSIPTQLGSLSNLEYLNLNGNRLSGAVPPQLGNLSNLQWLYLRNNDLSGPLPQSLTRITGLRVFRFAGNSGDLCASDDAAFQTWLQAIPFRSGPDCAVFADRDVLIALYNATDGPNWGNLHKLAHR